MNQVQDFLTKNFKTTQRDTTYSPTNHLMIKTRRVKIIATSTGETSETILEAEISFKQKPESLIPEHQRSSFFPSRVYAVTSPHTHQPIYACDYI